MADTHGNGDAEESYGHAECGDHEEGASADALNYADGGPGCGHETDGVYGGDDAGGQFGEADRAVEDEGEVVA